jgi:hypothetical protein
LALHESAPARSLLALDIVTLIYFIFIIQKLKFIFKILPEIKKIVGFISLVTCISIYSIQATNYSTAFDNRADYFRDKKNIHCHDLNQLPNCRIYKTANFKADSSHYSNQHVIMYYQLK